MELTKLKEGINQGKKFFPCIMEMVGIEFVKECGFRPDMIKEIKEDNNQLNGTSCLKSVVEIIDKLNIPFLIFCKALRNEVDSSVHEGSSLRDSLVSKVYDELKRRNREDLLNEQPQ